MAEYKKLYNESIKSPEKFWAKQAKNELTWFSPWKKVLQWKAPQRQMVCRRKTQCQLQLPRPTPGHSHGQQSRVDLGRRARRARENRAKNALTPTANCIAKSACSPMS